MQFVFVLRTKPHELFDHDAFDANIGKPIVVKSPNGPGVGRVVAVRVARDRRSVEITVETEGELLGDLITGN